MVILDLHNLIERYKVYYYIEHSAPPLHSHPTMDITKNTKNETTTNWINGDLEFPIIKKDENKSKLCINKNNLDSHRNKDMVIMFTTIVENCMKDSQRFGKKIFQI